MALLVSLKIKNSQRAGQGYDIVDDYARRSYDKTMNTSMSLSTSKTSIESDTTGMSSIEFVYIKVNTDDVTVNMYKNMSPEALTFGDMILITEASGVTSLSLSASAAASVDIYLAGS